MRLEMGGRHRTPGPLSALLVSAGLGLGAAAPTSAQEQVQKYAGTTSQGQRIALNVSSAGVRYRIAWQGECEDGGQPFESTTSNEQPLPVRRRGKFSDKKSFEAKADDGATVSFEISLVGEIQGGRALGTWEATAKGPYADGGKYTCSAKEVTWKAKK